MPFVAQSVLRVLSASKCLRSVGPLQRKHVFFVAQDRMLARLSGRSQLEPRPPKTSYRRDGIFFGAQGTHKHKKKKKKKEGTLDQGTSLVVQERNGRNLQ